MPLKHRMENLRLVGDFFQHSYTELERPSYIFPFRATALFIENTRFVSFDIKFTRQGFEKACLHREACRAIQHAFSKPSLVNLISKDTNLVFFLSVFVMPAIMTSFSIFVLIQHHYRCHSKSATSSWPDKGTCREVDNVYQAMCNYAVKYARWLINEVS